MAHRRAEETTEWNSGLYCKQSSHPLKIASTSLAQPHFGMEVAKLEHVDGDLQITFSVNDTDTVQSQWTWLPVPLRSLPSSRSWKTEDMMEWPMPVHQCKVVFPAYNHERDLPFDLVPRLIGRHGANVKRIEAVCGGKMQIRGRGSRHREALGADVPVHILLSCAKKDHLRKGIAVLEGLLATMGKHFECYCKRTGLPPSSTNFYSVLRE
jgi:hypothetical protein